MAIAVVQQVSVAHNAAASTRTATISAATAGNKLIAIGYIFSNSVSFDPTTPASGWSLRLDANPASSGQRMLWYAMDAAGGETSVVFTTSDASTKGVALVVYEVSGLLTGNSSDKTNSVALSGTTVTSRATGTTGTLTQADEIAIAAVMINGTSGGSEAWDSSFNISTTHARGWAGYKIVSATTALNPTASWTTLRSAHAGIVTFKQAAAVTPAILLLNDDED